MVSDLFLDGINLLRCGALGRYYPTGIAESVGIETAGRAMIALKIIE